MQYLKEDKKKNISKICINNHLLGDDVKFPQFFRLNELQFDFVLSLVKQDMKKLFCF